MSREAVVRKLNGERIQGQLLCATDSHIMLWRSPTAYDWRETDRNSELLSYADLDWIRVRGRHTILTGAFVGFLFGFTYGHVASTARTMDHMFPTESEQRWEGVLFGLGTALIGGAMGALSHRGEAYCFHKKNLDFEKTVTALSQQAMMWVTPSPELHAKEMAETP
ncbi:MAG: hypothetical protein FJY66_05620 [Calditrichaeota bacterium]|nr:hypothetical protein [Calditrichota bacterium]